MNRAMRLSRRSKLWVPSDGGPPTAPAWVPAPLRTTRTRRGVPRTGSTLWVPAAAAGGASPWPTFATTGVPAGTTLTTVTATTVVSGSYDAKDFINGLDLTGTSNVTFTRCRVLGRMEFGQSGSNRSFTDCDFDGNQAGSSATVGGKGMTLLRCRAWNAAQGLQGGNGLIRDCFFGELYGVGDSHCEGVLLAENNTEIDHCTIFGTFKAGGNLVTTGGMSAALAMYNHGAFWGPKNDNYVHDCLFQTFSAVYTVYWGTPISGDNPLTNCDLLNNTFRKVPGQTTSNPTSSDDIVSNFFGGIGNSIVGNVYEDSGLTVRGSS